MAEKQSTTEAYNLPAYSVRGSEERKSTNSLSASKKTLLVGAVAVSLILLAFIIVGVVYFYRSSDTLTQIAKMYHINGMVDQRAVSEDIEIDTNRNTVIVHMNGDGIEPGTFALFDYTKSLTGLYYPKERRCYLIAGIHQGFQDPLRWKESLERNATLQSTNPNKILRYHPTESYPISDKSFLPAALRNVCSLLPVNWLEPVDHTSTKGIQKRDCHWHCGVYSDGWVICVEHCN